MVAYNTSVVTQRIASYIASSGRGSQVKLAKALGVQPQTVNKWVKGQTCPEPERWAELEAAMGLEEGTLALESGLTTFSNHGELAELRAEVERLRQIVERLDSGQRARR